MFKYGKKKPQGATRNSARQTPAQAPSALPSWLLVGLGMGIGLFIAFMLYLWKPWQPVKRVAPTAAVEAQGKPPAEEGGSKLPYEFYHLLPSQKVVETEAPVEGAVPAATAKPPVPPPAKPAPSAASSADADSRRAAAILEGRAEKPKTEPVAEKKPAAKPADKTPEAGQTKSKETAKDKAAAKEKEKAKPQEADTTRFSLQAGSFKSQAEAERRKAKVALQGLPARVQQVTVKEGQVWYRVIVGPFKGKETSEKAQGSLRGDGIDSLMVKEKK